MTPDSRDDRTSRAEPIAIAALMFLGAAVRVWGLRFGLPLVNARPDELLISDRAIMFIRERTLDPDFFDYPSLYLYLTAALYLAYGAIGRVVGWFSSLDAFVESWSTHWVPFFLIGRSVGAVSGTLTVLVTYWVGRRLMGRTVGLVAAAFLSLAFLHVRDSHYATTDVPMTLLVMVAMAWIVRFWQDGRGRDGVLAGLWAGLATSVKYNAAVLLVPLVAASALRESDVRRLDLGLPRSSAIVRRGCAFGAAFLLAFLLTSPYLVVNWEKALHDLQLVWGSSRAGMTPPEMLGIGWWYHLRVSLRYGLGWPLLGTGLAGLAVLAVSRRPVALLLGGFPLAYYALTGNSYNVFVRYMVPVVPFLCVTAAFLVVEFASRAARRTRVVPARVWVAVLSGLIVWPSARSVVMFDRLLTERDSRLVAADWMLANVPPGSDIYQTGNGYGHVQLEFSRPFRYRHWTWEGGRFRSARRPFERTSAWPEWIVVHQSPLPYSHVPGEVARRLRTDYMLVHFVRAVDPNDSHNVYDVQDAFFVPFAGFTHVMRPGPNIFIYRRRP